MKNILVIFLIACACIAKAQDETTTNRYSMKLLKESDGSYSLVNRVRYEAILDLSRVPDLLAPYTYQRDKLQASDYADCETREFVYKTYPDYELKLAVDMARSDKPAPFVIYIHGGGWARGDNSANRDLSQYAALHGGVTGVRITYTLAGKPGATVLVTIQDVLDAVQFVRDHAAELNIDPSRVGFCGGSAGGHLSGVAAMMTPGCKVLVGVSGIYDLEKAAISARATDRERIRYFMDKDPEVLRKASAIHLIPGQNIPAVLLIHGTGDITVEWQQSQLFYDALKAQGAKNAVLKLYECYDHGVTSNASDQKEATFFEMYDFIVKNI